MRWIALLLLAGSATVLAQAPVPQAKADLKNVLGQSVGSVTLTETPHGVLVQAILAGVPEGVHAFHIHSTGICEPPFTSAGSHFNYSARQHGLLNAMGMHAGDLPNMRVPADGKLTFDALVTSVTLGGGANGLFREGGTALVIHAGPDDYKSDPAGNAGGRIACGLVVRMEP